MTDLERSIRESFDVNNTQTWSQECEAALRLMGWDFGSFMDDIWLGKYTRQTLLELREILELDEGDAESGTAWTREQLAQNATNGIAVINKWLSEHRGFPKRGNGNSTE